MKIVFVCHGEVEPRSGLPDFGHDVPPLSELGRRQAAALAAGLASRQPAAVYASPLRPALTTAELIAAALGLDAPSPSAAFTTLTPEVLPDGGSVGAEALHALQTQAWSAVEALKGLHPAEANLVVVSHVLPIRAVVGRALSLPFADLWRFAVEPASLTTIEFRGVRTLLAGLNDTCHLSPSA